MHEELKNKLMSRAIEVLTENFGAPSRETVKVIAWNARHDLGVVLQIDQPREQGVFIWLTYPPDGRLSRLSIQAKPGATAILTHRPAWGAGSPRSSWLSEPNLN